jgi:large subunit ribosomal protein L19
MEDVRNRLKPGMIVKVHQKIKDVGKKGEDKFRIQVFEGIVLAVKHGSEPGASVTVRKISNGVGVEKIFPIHSPLVENVELVRRMKVKQARAYYLRSSKKKLRAIQHTSPQASTAKPASTPPEKHEEPPAQKEVVQEPSLETVPAAQDV